MTNRLHDMSITHQPYNDDIICLLTRQLNRITQHHMNDTVQNTLRESMLVNTTTREDNL